MTDTAAPPETENQIIDEMGVKMALVPAGEFQMGSENGEDDEKLVHAVYLDDFYIDVYEVTNALYERCVQAGPCSAPVSSGSYTRDNYYGNDAYYNYPVINVNWDQASEFCGWRGRACRPRRNGRRLPAAGWKGGTTPGETKPQDANPRQIMAQITAIVRQMTRSRSAALGRTATGCTIWQATSGSGSWTGMMQSTTAARRGQTRLDL